MEAARTTRAKKKTKQDFSVGCVKTAKIELLKTGERCLETMGKTGVGERRHYCSKIFLFSLMRLNMGLATALEKSKPLSILKEIDF